ncbi:purine-binding chemotaxis protein CheW [Singulisphaera sp. GP187]|uniref:chemotaxis protein CheW n=1 Tax=Singulisphaera sp. GP187 TaxID=1882752 RepID=UPI000927B4E5|nr:chemotaxis protein CheW [Singulisphaera sp. GP187]SIO40777.1 purine-binding chemotaxis protein CheW [Singulisphaera sp. GP187]
MESQRLFCTFRVDGRLFGVDILDVKEVTAETTSTRVAHAPDEVLGLVNIRGHIYLALDLRRLLGVPATEVTGESRLVLFKPSVGSAFGVVVDQIAEIQTVDSNQIESFTQNDHENALANVRRVDLIDAVCKLSGELLVVLNPRRFLAVVEQKLSALA